MRKAVRPIAFSAGLLCGVVLTLALLSLAPIRAQRATSSPVDPPPVLTPASIPVPVQNVPAPAVQAVPDPTPIQPASEPQLPSESVPSTAPARPQVEAVATHTEIAPDEGDPEEIASGFVEKTRKDAQAAVDALNKQRDALRLRLKKVEGALRSWQSLLSALNQPPKPGALRAPDRGAPPTAPPDLDPMDAVRPQVLEPVSPPVERPAAVQSVPVDPVMPEPPKDAPVDGRASPTTPRPQS